MNAIIAAQYGDLNQVSVKEITTPATNPGEVLVEVKFAGINPLDIKLVSGAMHGYFPLETPFVVGTDFAGVVSKDSGVLRKGQRVFGRIEPLPGDGKKFDRTGAFAVFVSVPTTSLAEMPESLTMETAAALPTSCGTAWQAIFEAGKVQAGQTVLIHGGAGGVGGFAVQFAHQAGARVIATASGAKLDYVRKLGAEEVIDYTANEFSLLVEGVDLVLDTIGGETQDKSFGVLRKGGTLLSTVQPPDESKAASHGVNSAFVFHTTNSDRLRKLAELVAKGTVHVEIASVFPLQKGIAALEQVATGSTKGKVVISIP
jgi:NADPH:quinone reductase-like Zn-dependent oxidoreductase